jgi:hypothetical protein
MSKLEFLNNQANKVEGLQYAGFETFKGSPYTSCARETGQNSRDAAFSNDSPVRVSFNRLSVPRSDVPFAEKLEHSIKLCLKDPQDAKTLAHLQRALQHVQLPEVSVLEISDSNTTGLTGPTDDSHSVFAALVKGDGVTLKQDLASSGSFGIGKNAAFAVSELQTVVYTTCWSVPGEESLRFAAQARVRLISHTDGKAKYSAEGYWGGPDFKAIESLSEVPEWMRRKDRGTTIFAVGFTNESDWKSRIALSLATNFCIAIERSEIEFTVDGEKTAIDQVSIDRVLSDVDLYECAKDMGQEASLGRAEQLLECVRRPTDTQTIKVPGLGEFFLHVLVRTGLPREVHIIRNGIYITDNLIKFGHPMRKFPGTREFFAVLEPSSGKGGQDASAILKRIENPEHNAFEPERIADHHEQREVRRLVKLLHSAVRDAIRRIAKVSDATTSQLDELSHIFSQTGTFHANPGAGSEDDAERFEHSSGQSKTPDAVGGQGLDGPGNQRGRHDLGRHGSTRTGPVRKTQKKAGSQRAQPFSDVRSTVAASGSSCERSIHFTPAMTGEVFVAISAVGLSEDVELRLDSTSEGTLVKGRIRLMVTEGERVSLEVRFAERLDGPIHIFPIAGTPKQESSEP